MSKAPIWYTVEEIAAWLKRERPILSAAFIAEHLQKAFEKGYSIAIRSAHVTRPEDSPDPLKSVSASEKMSEIKG